MMSNLRKLMKAGHLSLRHAMHLVSRETQELSAALCMARAVRLRRFGINVPNISSDRSVYILSTCKFLTCIDSKHA